MARPLVVIYGRRACHPCVAAHLQVLELGYRIGFDVEAVDIDDDEAAHARYMFEIPVVVFEGRELAKAPISPVALEEALREALHGRSSPGMERG